MGFFLVELLYVSSVVGKRRGRKLYESLLQDRLETEIDEREPRSFKENLYQYHWTRQDGFQYVQYTGKDGTEHQQYVSWQRWAWDYWYETRFPNASCPMMPKGLAAMW